MTGIPIFFKLLNVKNLLERISIQTININRINKEPNFLNIVFASIFISGHLHITFYSKLHNSLLAKIFPLKRTCQSSVTHYNNAVADSHKLHHI